jgi:hypothetical protein
VRIGSTEEWFANLVLIVNTVIISTTAIDLYRTFKNHFGVRISTDKKEQLMNLKCLKATFIRFIDSLWFRLPLFLLGVGVAFVPPMRINLFILKAFP